MNWAAISASAWLLASALTGSLIWMAWAIDRHFDNLAGHVALVCIALWSTLLVGSRTERLAASGNSLAGTVVATMSLSVLYAIGTMIMVGVWWGWWYALLLFLLPSLLIGLGIYAMLG